MSGREIDRQLGATARQLSEESCLEAISVQITKRSRAMISSRSTPVMISMMPAKLVMPAVNGAWSAR
jgi:hypothetical protein